jgi:hypothetical protein
MADGALTFTSWVRRGLGTALSAVEGSSPGPTSRVRIDTLFNVEELATTNLPLIAPGDIVGLDPNVVTRVWPRPDDLDAEFASYPLIEFGEGDLPWRYTPARNSGDERVTKDDRLRPWISLVVIPTSEGSIAPPTPDRKVAVLTVTNSASLPDPGTLWALGHTQFEGTDVDDPDDIVLAKEKLDAGTGLALGRILSSRLLRENTEYLACLVPTFERGRLVGTGKLTEEAADTTDALAGWNLTAPVEFPVYYSWRFRTGKIANFEAAARLLKPFVLPPTVGRRDMDVRSPGPGLPRASLESLPVEGALMSVAAFEQGPPPWPNPDRQTFIDALKALVNAPTRRPEPILAPPLYGQWYAAEIALGEERPSGTNPPWFHELNRDPRQRVAAGLGTQVIQNEQQALLAGAWDQVEEIDDVNSKLRGLQLTRGILTRIWKRYYLTASQQRFFHMTHRLHSRVVCGDDTVCGRVRSSAITPGFMSAQWQRFSRPQGAIGLLQGRPEAPFPGAFPSLLTQLNACGSPAPNPDDPPEGLHDPNGGIIPGGLPCDLIEEVIALGSSVTLHWGLLILWVSRELLVSRNGECWWIGLKALRYAITLIYVSMTGGADDLRRRCRFALGTFSIQDLLASPKMPSFAGFASLPTTLPLPTAPGGSSSTDSAAAAQVRAALIALFAKFAPPPEQPCKPPMDLPECQARLVTELDPTITVGERLLRRLVFDTSFEAEWNPIDPLEPLLVVPEYERPMYEPLKAISYDWLIPGVDQIEPDSVGLAVTNQRFIEAYMAGLNQEMTRELLWNEYPTDQRGTYFRQFWSIAGHILEDGSSLPPDQLRDIKPLRQWSKSASLGDNSPRLPPGGDPDAPFLVLVVRGQVIRKYPNVIVYAQQLDPVTHELTGRQEHPIFYALLDPDIAFYGFSLTAEDIRADERWYFVLQEQPGEPKFADPINDSLTTPHTPDPTALGSSAGLFAERTFLQPFRLGIQGSSMLPATP